MSDDDPLPWKGPFSKGIKHRYLAQFLTHLKNWKHYMRVLWVDIVRGGVFIHSRWVWVENDDDNDKGCWNDALLSLLCFVSKCNLRGVEEMEAALTIRSHL